MAGWRGTIDIGYCTLGIRKRVLNDWEIIPVTPQHT